MADPLLERLHEALARSGLKREARAWALLAAWALAVAGLFALLLALARTPVVQDLLPWRGDGFFRKALVTHVDFSFVVWFLALLGVLLAFAAALLPKAGPAGAMLGRIAVGLGILAFFLMALPALLDRGLPALNNYVPVLEDPIFMAGLVALFLALGLVSARLLAGMARPERVRDELALAGAAAALAILVSFLCFLIALGHLPKGLDPANWAEHLFWGGGHVLQFAYTILLVAIWQLLSRLAFGQPALSPALYRAVLFAFLPFIVAAPFFYARHPILSLEQKSAFADLFLYGLVLPSLVAGLGVLTRWRQRAQPGGAAGLALILSVLLYGLGGLAGYTLGPNDTRIPAHYHAVIGGVNLAAMGFYYAVLLPLLGRPILGRKKMAASLWLYGLGQFLWTAGMFLAGLLGVARKTAGAAQGLDSAPKTIAMTVMGVGGVMAVAGGVLFVALILYGLLARRTQP